MSHNTHACRGVFCFHVKRYSDVMLEEQDKIRDLRRTIERMLCETEEHRESIVKQLRDIGVSGMEFSFESDCDKVCPTRTDIGVRVNEDGDLLLGLTVAKYFLLHIHGIN